MPFNDLASFIGLLVIGLLELKRQNPWKETDRPYDAFTMALGVNDSGWMIV